MSEAEAAAEAEGKEVLDACFVRMKLHEGLTKFCSSFRYALKVKEKGLLYFRKPDVNHGEGQTSEGLVSAACRMSTCSPSSEQCQIVQSSLFELMPSPLCHSVSTYFQQPWTAIWEWKLDETTYHILSHLVTGYHMISSYHHMDYLAEIWTPGFKVAEGTAVTFRLYVDSLGAGALDVSPA